jgi:capsular exopolysaccharide synthesis family protein
MFGEPDAPEFELADGRYPVSGRSVRERVAARLLLENLSIDPARLSRLVEIKFTSPDPELSASVANVWAENFIRTNLERKVQSTSFGREQLAQQLAEYKDRLDESQRQLVAYASAQEIINLPGQSEGLPDRPIVVDTLAALNSTLTAATADRIQAEARFRQAGTEGATSQALTNMAINELRAQRAELAAEYRQLMIRFEPGYPAAQAIQSRIDELDRSISAEEARVSNAIAADYRQSLQRERELENRVNELKREYLDLRNRSIQYNVFQQEVDTNQALYDGLLQRFKEIGVAGGVGVNNVAIVDRANVPQNPSSPSLILNLLASILIGAAIGAGLALALEQFDEGFTDPSEVKRKLGLALLGSVPKTHDETPAEALLDPKSELTDGYLSVYASLGFSTEHGVPRSFAVTSTKPAEGKSTTALALAAILARGGRSVILVDGDMRSPSVHQLGGVNHDRGLSNFLSGENDIEPLTFQMQQTNLTAMSAGPIPPNAATLLMGDRLSILIDRLQKDYDHVIIDSPPVMGLADALLIGNRVEGVLYAVQAEGTRSSHVKTSLNRLTSANVRVLGCVLTKFEARKNSHGYGYEYGYGYGREVPEARPA